MSRRSSRLASRNGHETNKSNDAELNPSDPEFSLSHSDGDFTSEPEDYVERPAKKKARTAVRKNTKDPNVPDKWKNVRGRRGLLKELVEAPIDVIMEIFSHLQIPDILALSRTTKSLRAMLLDKTYPGTLSIWQTAHNNVPGLPALPDGFGMTEPQFASLAFDGFCNRCNAPHVSTVVWEARERLCKKCIDANYVDYRELQYTSGMDFEETRALESIIPTYQSFTNNRRRLRITLYSLPHCREELAEFKSIVGQDERKEWLNKKREAFKRQKEFATECLHWSRRQSQNRSTEIQDLKEARKEAIISRLAELGWQEEFEKMTTNDRREFENLKSVKQAKLLTDRIWLNINSGLIAFLENVKKDRIVREHREIKKTRFNLLTKAREGYLASVPTDVIVPETGDIYLMKPFQEILEDTPFEVEITVDSFEAAWTGFPSLQEDWRKGVITKVLSLHPSLKQEEDLSLPGTLFRCNSCSDGTIRFPQVIVHRCCTQQFYSSSSNQSWNANQTQAFEALGRMPWSDKNIVYNSALLAKIEQLLTNLKLDRSTVELENFLENPVFVQCLQCCRGNGDNYIYRAPDIIYHLANSYTHTFSNSPPDCRVVTKEEMSRLPEECFKVPSPKHDYSDYSQRWRCAHCKLLLPSPGSYRRQHMKEKHDIDETSDEDFYPDLDRPQEYGTMFKLKPLEIETPANDSDSKKVDTEEAGV